MSRIARNNLRPDEKRVVAVNMIVQNGQSVSVCGEVPGALINDLEDILIMMDNYMINREIERRSKDGKRS